VCVNCIKNLEELLLNSDIISRYFLFIRRKKCSNGFDKNRFARVTYAIIAKNIFALRIEFRGLKCYANLAN